MSNKLEKFATPHDELMALAGKATPGEWEAVEHSWSDTSIVAATHTVARMSISDEATEENQYELQARESANAAFIAAACNFVRSDAFRAMVRDSWQPFDSAPKSTPTELSYFLAYCPNDSWGVGGNVHFAVSYSHLPAGTCRPVGTNGERRFTHWMPLPAPPQAIDAVASEGEK